MKTIRTLLIAVLITVSASVFAQGDSGKAVTTNATTISIDARGDDVRGVLHDLFTQSKKNFILEPNVRFVLYLSLKGVEFDEALELVCKTSSLTYEIQNGIYFVKNAPKEAPKAQETPAKPKGKLPASALQKKLTTRDPKVDIRLLFLDIQKQTGVTIEVDKSVPSYKLDAFLINTSLKYALDTITQAAGISYKLTDNQSILLFKPESENHVSIHSEGGI